MATIDRTSALAAVEEKVLAGERLDLDDGVAILESDDILTVGRLADTARRLRGGTDEVYFVNNLYLNHTNICRVKCKFCAFARTGKQDGAYVHDIADLVAHAVEVHETQEFSEIHMVGGEHPGLTLDYYVDLNRT
jgi:aminodeoxyfutalosine synthase